MPRVAIIVPDQRRAKGKAPAPSKAAPPKQTKVPERLYQFEVAPPPAANAPPVSATVTQDPATASQQQPPSAESTWPFPVVLPSTPSSTSLPAPITKSDAHGRGYEYGPKIYLDRADFWDDASPSPSSSKKASSTRSKKSKSKKKGKGEKKLCPTNGYITPASKSSEKCVQVKLSMQEKEWTTTTKEFLSGGAVRRVWVTYSTVVHVEEERPVDEEGNVVESGEEKDEDVSLRARPGEVNIKTEWSSEEESDSSDSSGVGEEDDDSSDDEVVKSKKGKAKEKKKGKGKGGDKKHKPSCPKHPRYTTEQGEDEKSDDTVTPAKSETTKPEEQGQAAVEKATAT